MNTKRCPCCGETKSTADFGRNQTLGDGLSFYCLTCNRAKSNAHYRKRRQALGKRVRDHSWVPEGFRWCPSCKRAVAHEDYARSTSTASGFSSSCKACKNAASSASYFYRAYKLTKRQVDELRVAQGDECAICRAAAPQHLDHDHATGGVRALLCFNCNGGLGQFRDDPDVLRAAADYVEHHRARQAGTTRETVATSRPTAARAPVAPPVGSGRRRRVRLAADRLCSRTLMALAIEAETREADG